MTPSVELEVNLTEVIQLKAGEPLHVQGHTIYAVRRHPDFLRGESVDTVTSIVVPAGYDVILTLEPQ